jgi:hypothetical protein
LLNNHDPEPREPGPQSKVGPGVVSTVCGYMREDGFTLVTRKYKQKREIKLTKAERYRKPGNSHTTARLSKSKKGAKPNMAINRQIENQEDKHEQGAHSI